MSLILCLETATEVCSVALAENGVPLIVETISEGLRHSAQLVPLVDKCLQKAKKQRSELDAVAISNGPGSYTGLRVGASTAKAMAYALEIPLIAIPTLQSLADEHRHEERVVIASVDARRMEAYIGIYKSGAEVAPPYNIIWDEVSLGALVGTYGSVVICGNGIEKSIASIPTPEDIIIAPSRCDASKLCRLAQLKFSSQRFVDTAYHAPLYYKSPNITKPKLPFGKMR